MAPPRRSGSSSGGGRGGGKGSSRGSPRGGPPRGKGGRPPAGKPSSARGGPSRSRKPTSGGTARDDTNRADWGGVTRRGAGRVRDRNAGGEASKTWRRAVDSDRASITEPSPSPVTGPPRQLDEWILVEEIRDEAEHAVERATTSPPRSNKPRGARQRERSDDDQLRRQLGQAGGPDQQERVERRLRVAARDFDAERFPEAARRLKALSEQAPGVAAVRELYGMTLYRQGRWKLAAKELEAFRALSGSTEQNPVLADCYRALRRWSLVEELWDELREASPSGELVTEGRIVMAGSFADRGNVDAAIRVLEDGWKFPKRARVHHLRRAYALADLYERAGDMSRARELFGRVQAADPDFADVRSRLRSLG